MGASPVPSRMSGPRNELFRIVRRPLACEFRAGMVTVSEVPERPLAHAFSNHVVLFLKPSSDRQLSDIGSQHNQRTVLGVDVP